VPGDAPSLSHSRAAPLLALALALALALVLVLVLVLVLAVLVLALLGRRAYHYIRLS
jgi:hypothetical protein